MGMFTLNKKQKKKLKSEKYTPLGNRFDNQLQVLRAAQRRAYGILKPKLRAETQEGIQTRQAHKGREKDISQNYEYFDNRAREAYAKASAAMDRVLSTSIAGNTASQANLQAALAQTRGEGQETAGIVGGVLPPGGAASADATAAALGATSLGSLGEAIAQGDVLGAQGIARVAQGRTRAKQDETERFTAKIGQIQKAKKEIKSEAGAVTEEQRKAIEDAEIAKATERAREKIARGSLHLGEREAGETERHNRATEDIAWGQIRTEKEAIQAQIEQAEAEGNDAAAAKAKAEQEKYNSAVAVFSEYVQNVPGKKVDPKDLFRKLRLVVSRKLALKIMSHTTNKKIRKWIHGFKTEGPGYGEKKGPPNPETGKVGP